MRKILTIILTICGIISFVAFNGNAVNASAYEEKDSDYVLNRSEPTVRNLMGGATVYKQTAQTLYSGITDPTASNYRVSPQTFQWVDLPVSSEDVKVVTWSQGTQDSFKASTTTKTALDFEENNPGWIVVAAVNGDFFHIQTTYEAISTMVQGGDVYRAEGTGGDQQVLGWTDDNELIVGNPTIDSTMTLHIYDEDGNEIEELPIEKYNQAPSETGITLLTKDMVSDVDLTGYEVYVGKYEICRISNVNYRPFVKGTIQSITNELTNSRPMLMRDVQTVDANGNPKTTTETVREFYLASKDGSLNGKLDINTYVKCQFDLNGAWENVTSAVGYYNKILDNYQPLHQDSYNDLGLFDEKTAVKPRMAIGFKEDGSVVVMDIDGRAEMQGRTGVSCFEAGELMRLAGCKEAYNLDGGGSATLIVRNNYGNFDIVNTPSDGSERSIANAVLFVMRDPGLKWDIAETTRDAIAISRTPSTTTTDIFDQVTDIKVTVNGVTKEMPSTSSLLLLDGLEEDTDYEVTVSYKVPSEKDPTKLLNGQFKVTARTKPFEMPVSGLQISEINKNSITITRRVYDYSSGFKNVVVQVGDTEYPMGTLESMVIEGLIDNTEYDITFKYDFYEEATGNTYKGTEQKKAKTLSFELPAIDAFKVSRVYKDRVLLQYTYKDVDSRVTSANIVVNGVNNPITSKSGTYTVNNMDFENEDYVIYFEISYVNEYGSSQKIKSEEIVYSKTALPSHNIIYNLDGGVNESNAPSTYTEGTAVTLPIPTKEGYTFLGWYSGETKIESIKATDNTDIEVTAKWQKVETPDPTPTPTPTPTEPETKKKGCKKSMEYLMSLTTLLGLACFLFRKKK